MSRSDEVRARQRSSNEPLTPLAVWMTIIRQLGEHVDHPWRQVGPCVYCDTCGVRLYQGEALTEDDKNELRDAVREASRS
jgi:hypothetical protein